MDDSLERDGYVLLAGIFGPSEALAMAVQADAALRSGIDATLRTEDGSIYGARNVAEVWPNAASVWQRPALLSLLHAVLGPRYGLVRILFFDKPPEQTWALPWHRDLTIAVKNNRLPSARFRKPTMKAGVAHIQAQRDVLDNMLTLRLHLDDVTDENGPLRVVPGSHRDEACDRPPAIIHAAAGDVLAMRPLLLHCSHRSHAETRRHRRILHLEFAGSPELPDGFAWQQFITPAG